MTCVSQNNFIFSQLQKPKIQDKAINRARCSGTYNLSYSRGRDKDHKFKASLHNLVILCLKTARDVAQCYSALGFNPQYCKTKCMCTGVFMYVHTHRATHLTEVLRRISLLPFLAAGGYLSWFVAESL